MTRGARRGIDPEALGLALADLKRSGLGPECLEPGSGISVLSREQAVAFHPDSSWWKYTGGAGLHCLLFDYGGGIFRLRRLETAAPGSLGAQVDLQRYDQSRGTRPGVWIPRNTIIDAALKDPKARLVVVEGEKKAEALARADIPAIGLGGVWNTGSRKKGIEVLPELLDIEWAGREVVLLFDTDPKPKTRSDVGLAARRAGSLVRRLGAFVKAAHLPAEGDEKIAADDYLASQGVEALKEVLDGAEDVPPEERTDLGNARRFAAAAAGSFLYVPQWRAWLAYDGRRWARDSGDRARELAIQVVKDILMEARAESDRQRADALAKHAFASQSRTRIEAMLALAPDEAPELKVDPNELDGHRWLLNVENGTIDLRSGALLPHDPGHLLTQLGPVTYDPKAASTLWEKTLREIHPDKATRDFLQRWLGYCLTGSVREEKLGFWQGPGRNGKGVLMETVLALLGRDYAGAAPENFLMTRKMETHATEMADLYRKRLVFASETAEGRSWNTARVKALTGGDRIKARRMREDFWEYDPTHKLVVLSNPLPRANAEDHALFDRLKLVPFGQVFRDADDPDPTRKGLPVKNPRLKEMLLRELPAVLGWMVRGCLAWQRDGLGEPAEVRKATADYRERLRELDPVGRFPFRFSADKTGNPRPLLLRDAADQFNGSVEPHRKLTTAELADHLRAQGYLVKKGTANKTYVYPRSEKDSDNAGAVPDAPFRRAIKGQ